MKSRCDDFIFYMKVSAVDELRPCVNVVFIDLRAWFIGVRNIFKELDVNFFLVIIDVQP